MLKCMTERLCGCLFVKSVFNSLICVYLQSMHVLHTLWMFGQTSQMIQSGLHSKHNEQELILEVLEEHALGRIAVLQMFLFSNSFEIRLKGNVWFKQGVQK